MTADNTSGHNIFIAFEPKTDRIFFHSVEGDLGKSFGIHQIQTFSGYVMFCQIFFHICIHEFLDGAAVFLRSQKLSVHDLDQWFQTEQGGAEVCGIGYTAAGFQIVQISRMKEQKIFWFQDSISSASAL